MPQALIPAIISGAVSTGIAYATKTIVAGAILKTFFVSTALSLAGTLLMPKPKLGTLADQSTALQDRLQMVRNPIAPRRIVYGRQKVSGPILFIESTTGNPSSVTADGQRLFLTMFVAFASHEIDRFEEIFIGDDKVKLYYNNTNNNTWTGGTISDPDNPLKPVSGDFYHDYVQILPNHGTANGITLPADSECQPIDKFTEGELTQSTKYWKGIAGLLVKLKYNADKFPNGIPKISATIRGKKVYDLNQSATVWSDNPAYIFRDYMKDTKFGMGVTDAELDDTQLATAGQTCYSWVTHKDVSTGKTFTIELSSGVGYYNDPSTSGVTLHDGDRVSVNYNPATQVVEYTHNYYVILMGAYHTTNKVQRYQFANSEANWKTRTSYATGLSAFDNRTAKRTEEVRYTCNGTLLSTSTHESNLTNIMASCGGAITYTGGVFRMSPSAYASPSLTLTDDDFVGDIQMAPKLKRRERFNGVKGLFVGIENDYQPSDYPAFQQTSFSNSDGEVIYRDLNMDMVSNGYQAQRIAKTILFQSRNEITMSCSVNLKGLRLIPNDRVQVTLSRFGFTNQIFRVVEVGLGSTDEAILVNLLLREDTSQAYNFDPASDAVVVDPTPDTTLPTFKSATAPTSVSLVEQTSLIHDDGTSLSSAKVTFTQVDIMIKYHSLILSASADNSSFSLEQIVTLNQGNTSHVFTGLQAGRYYKVTVTAVNQNEVASASVTSSTIQIGGDSVAPSAFSALTATAGNASVKLAWTNPSDADYARAEFYRATSVTNISSSTTPSFYVNGSAGKAQEVFDGGKTNTQQYRYWIRAVDHSANTSAWYPNNTSGITVTPSSSADFTAPEELTNDGAISGTKLAVDELSAISATIGLLRTATSGNRMEVHSDKVKVFDSNGNERVRLGNLS